MKSLDMFMRQEYYNETMISSQEKKGRVNQKRRTRIALLQAAARLLKEGRKPTVAEVAEEALVSRATAYRYFPTQESILVEAPLESVTPTADDMFGDDKTSSPEDRVALVQRILYELCRENEAQLRLLLRVSMDRWLEGGVEQDELLRGGRRNVMLESALEPVREDLDEEVYDKLLAALAVMVGIESLVVLRDIWRLDHERASEVMDWAVRTLVRASLGKK